MGTSKTTSNVMLNLWSNGERRLFPRNPLRRKRRRLYSNWDGGLPLHPLNRFCAAVLLFIIDVGRGSACDADH